MDLAMKCVLYLFVFNLTFNTSYPQSTVVGLSHYLFPKFIRGVILMKSGIKNQALLNYNSLTEEMIFENNGKKLAITKGELGLVDTVFIEDRKFIVLNNKFFELGYHSKSDLYVEHRCSMIPPGKPSAYGGTSQTSSITSISSFNSGGQLYDLKLPEGYEIKPYICYWLRKNGELNKFINMKQLMKLYDYKKDLFKAYVKKYDVRYDNQETIVQLIKYLETN